MTVSIQLSTSHSLNLSASELKMFVKTCANILLVSSSIRGAPAWSANQSRYSNYKIRKTWPMNLWAWNVSVCEYKCSTSKLTSNNPTTAKQTFRHVETQHNWGKWNDLSREKKMGETNWAAKLLHWFVISFSICQHWLFGWQKHLAW